MTDYNQRLATLDTELRYVEAELVSLSEEAGTDPLNEDQQTRWDEGTAFVTTTEAAIVDLSARAAVAEKARNRQDSPAEFQIIRTPNKSEAMNVARNGDIGEVRDGILRNLEAADTDDTTARRHLRKHATGPNADERWARSLLVKSTEVYASAFSKFMTGRDFAMTAEERAAMSSTTAASGGSAVPTHLDPTFILTSDGSANAVRPISRVETLTEGNTWNGVSTAGVSASFDAPQAEVSDDSPTVAAPSVPLHKAQALVQAEIEAIMDIANLGNEVLTLFGDAKEVLEGSVHCTGTGSDQPTGIFTALDANTNVEIDSTTAATIGLVDLQAIRRGTPQRFRGRGSWLTEPTWADEVRNLGTALSASFSAFLTDGPVESWYGRPVVETDDAPALTTTTVQDNRIIYGDFSNYLIVDKPGSATVRFIPDIFGSNNLPQGISAWYMYWRSGADSINDLAFRLLQDKTSA